MERHDHCACCYSRNCTFDLVEDVSCELVECTNTCGHIFHQCKLEDHLQICQNSVVSCINKRYGCPAEVKRKKMSLHLKTCPANIIICTMEWNRRDCASLIVQGNHEVVLRDMKDTASVHHDFDIACAAHDQRILLETIMPNEVLKYYSDLADLETAEGQKAQVSFKNTDEIYQGSTDSVDLAESKETQVCANSQPSEKDDVSHDTMKISQKPDSNKPQLNNNHNKAESNRPDHVKSYINVVPDCDYDKNEPSPLSNQAAKVSTNDNSQLENTDGDTPGHRKKPGLLSKLRHRGVANISSLRWLPQKEYRHVETDTESLPINRTTLEWLSPEVSLRRPDSITRIFSVIGSSSRRPSGERSVSHYKLESSTQTVPPFLIHVDLGCIGRQLSNYSLYSSSIGQEERRRVRSLLMKGAEKQRDCGEFEISNNLAFHSLGLNPSIDFFSRFSGSRRESWFASLASFTCGCILRRDQYASHVKNVHCEIISALNGWLEQKCPYSAYGCRFTSFRFCPGNNLNQLVYHHSMGSFAVMQPSVYDQTHCDEKTQDCHLLLLTYDALMHVFKFLDPFTLNQLSLTCKYLREMCKNHLIRRGLVELIWKKRDKASPKWICDETIWYFPLAFEEINWKISDDPLMAVHLEKCPVKAKQDCEVGSRIHSKLPVLTSTIENIKLSDGTSD